MNHMMFIEKTKSVLMENKYNENSLSSNGFRVINSEKPQNCILVFGINPAGDEKDAKAEKGATYLYSLGDKEIQDRTYNKFYKPIFELISNSTDDNVKWDWCNLSKDDITTMINKDNSLNDCKEEIFSHYSHFKNKKYTLCIGEFFYYHETKQAEFLKRVKKGDIKNYFQSMLNMHIEALISAGHQIKAILILNATAGKLLCEAIGQEKYPSLVDYEYRGKKYRIFFSSMLSGQRAIDVFSKDRLSSDLKKHLCENDK